jgi:hypothetical protein
MLPPFIIEQIRRREEEESREQPQPVVHLPLPMPVRRDPVITPDEPNRGVVVIDLL